MNKLNLGNKFFIHELTGIGNFEEYYQILDSEGVEIAAAAEEASFGAKIAKLFLDKSLIPAIINVKDSSGDDILRIEQEFAFPQTNFSVKEPGGKCICVINQKMSLIGSHFDIYDSNMRKIALIMGDFRNKKYLIRRTNNDLLTTINHKNSGFFRDILTTADDYEIELENCDYTESLISLAATLCVDFAFHES